MCLSPLLVFPMPRSARSAAGGYCYHVLNRGNAKATVFHKPGDYTAFVQAIADASTRLPMRVLAYCLMPNHFHLVLWPQADGDLGRWMHAVMSAHVRRYHAHYQSSGHVWQGRYKSFPIQEDDHLYTVLRYVERNPLRAKLVRRAENWAWSSLSTTSTIPLTDWPVTRPADWIDRVNAVQTEAELTAIRTSINRGVPFGQPDWTGATARDLGISIRARGRPRK